MGTNKTLKHRGTETTESGRHILCELCASVFNSPQDLTKPIGVSEYQITEHLPDDLRSSLPTIEQIDAELGEVDDE